MVSNYLVVAKAAGKTCRQIIVTQTIGGAMFDANTFKRRVKEWIRVHPTGELADLQDFCEELVPPTHYTSHQWLIEQTLDWYKNILTHRALAKNYDYDDRDDSGVA